MLGSDRFAFETPNVIDPGDMPPNRPSRVENNSTTASTAANSTFESNVTDENTNNSNYSVQHKSRLLNDIHELDLSPVKSPNNNSTSIPYRDFPRSNNRNGRVNGSSAYSPYDDDDEIEDDETRYNHNYANPNQDEARIHAASLLKHSNGTGPLPFGRTLKLPNSGLKPGDGKNHHLVRRKIMEVIRRYGLIILGIAAFVGIVTGISFAIANKRNSNNHTNHKKIGNYAGTERYSSIVNYLVDMGVSSREDLESKHTPQNTALNWIVGTDTLQYPLPSTEPNSRLVQRYVLAVLYFATGGAERWDHTLSFTSNQDECGWNSVVATPEYITEELAVGVSCNQYLQVTSLFLPENSLQGSLPSELNHLTALQLLGIQGNPSLTGILPDLGRLTNLIYVNFNNNTFTGGIPPYFGDFQKLQVLGLTYNDFEGEVPPQLAGASKLKTVGLSGNRKLTGELNFATSLTELEYFYADRCQFVGKVENSFFENVGNLREIDLSHNILSGAVPLDILQYEHNLAVIDLGNNRFYGNLPSTMNSNYVLEYLNLRDNNITGILPESIDNLHELRHLDLQGNQMTGTIPNAMGRLAELTYLFLGDNRFDPVLPPLSQLLNLRELSLSDMGLKGTIPSWLSYLTSLQLLDLSHNELTGTVPQAIWDIPFFLLLNNNQLVGPLPTTGGTQLDLLSIQHNNIQDSNMDNVFCKEEMVLEIAVTDCQSGCSTDCCDECCNVDDQSCANDILGFYRGGLDFSASFFAFDPDILDEAGLFSTYDMQQEGQEP